MWVSDIEFATGSRKKPVLKNLIFSFQVVAIFLQLLTVFISMGDELYES